MEFITELENSCSVAIGIVVVYGYCVGKLAKPFAATREMLSVWNTQIFTVHFHFFFE